MKNVPQSRPCSSKKIGNRNLVIVSVYVDDLLFTGNNPQLLFDFKKSMMKEFEMTDLGKMSYFLGIEVTQMEEGFFICQKK